MPTAKSPASARRIFERSIALCGRRRTPSFARIATPGPSGAVPLDDQQPAITPPWVGALQAELLQIDVEPDAALPRLGAKLAMIGERCAEGRIGALLPEDALAGVTPVSAARTALRESLHVALVILTHSYGSGRRSTRGAAPRRSER
ncbi:hypothetical protein [Streptomyces sp. NPDC006459]|uniref:hypothetical protein n=1 Tax=Streptomyces sp. NPDC006459 TaxID=3154303 RepID=UPI0033A065E2